MFLMKPVLGALTSVSRSSTSMSSSTTPVTTWWACARTSPRSWKSAGELESAGVDIAAVRYWARPSWMSMAVTMDFEVVSYGPVRARVTTDRPWRGTNEALRHGDLLVRV